jgi:hypothetical protein
LQPTFKRLHFSSIHILSHPQPQLLFNTYETSAALCELLALSVANADEKACDTNVDGHGAEEEGNARGNLAQFLSVTSSHNLDLFAEETAEN